MMTIPTKLLAWPMAGLLAMAASLPAQAVEPFTVDYEASYKGIPASGRMTLESTGGDRWKYTVSINAPIGNLTQTTVFEDRNGQWRPLSNTDSANLLMIKDNKNATYDWASREARWSGDVDADRAGPVKLRAGDLDVMLVNLALPRDVAAGKPLDYRVVDNGRAKQVSYQVTSKGQVEVDGKTHAATKVERTDGDKQYVVWVVDGIPVPVRIVERRKGKDDIELRIKSVR